MPPHLAAEFAPVQTRNWTSGRLAILQALVLASAACGLDAACADSFDERFAPFAHAVTPLAVAANAADAIALAVPLSGPAGGAERPDALMTLAAYAPSEPGVIFQADDDRFTDGWSIRGITFAEPTTSPAAQPADTAAAPGTTRPTARTVSKPIAGDTATRIAVDAPAAPMQNDLAGLIASKAEAHGVPLPLAHAVVRVESNYKPAAKGRGGALGLMQIKYATAKGLGFNGPAHALMDPATNLEWGMRYLAGARKLAKGDLCNTVLKYQYGHRAERATKASSVYCGKVRSFMGSTAVVEARGSKAERKSERRRLAEAPEPLRLQP